VKTATRWFFSSVLLVGFSLLLESPAQSALGGATTTPAPLVPPPPPVEIAPVPEVPSTATLPAPVTVPILSPHYTGAVYPVTTTETAAIVGPQSYNILTTATLTPEALGRLLPPRKTDVYLAVTLRDLIQFAVEQNLDYRISQVNYEIAQEEATAQWGLFDPLLTVSVEEDHTVRQGSLFGGFSGGAGNLGVAGARQMAAQPHIEEPLADVNRQQLGRSSDPQIQALKNQLTSLTAQLAGALQTDYQSVVRSRTRNAVAQVTEEIPWGGSVGMGYSINRSWMTPTFLNINPAYSQSALVWIDHPLPFFRNWGKDVQMSGIRLAEKNQGSREWDKRLQLINQIATVMSGYWDLVNAIYSAEVQRLSRDSAANLLKINEIRLKHEVGTEIDVWEARAGVAQRENALIAAGQAIGLAQDNLARLTRQKEGSSWKIRMIPRDAPHYEEYPVDEEKFIADAHSRPDVQEARLMQDRAEIRRKTARNAVMPQLDAFGQYGLSGLGPSPGRAGHFLGTGDYHSWSLGLDFSVPLPNTQARARAREADHLVKGADLLIEKTVDFAEFEVRKAVRDLQTARESIRVTQTQVRSEQEKLRGELKRYEVGMATSQDLLDYQNNLASAQNAHIAALVAYNKAIIDLERARGTLLDSLGELGAFPIKVGPASPTEPSK